MVVRMGRWSEGSRMSVVQVAELVKWVGMIVRSGDVGCCLCRWVGGGSLVGLSSLIMEWVESLIRLLIVIPLWSFVGECQV